MNYNKVILIGNVTRDIELKLADSGNTYCDFSIAVSKIKKREDGAYFFNCTAFSTVAENLCAYAHKGTNVLIEGTLEQNIYTDKAGNKRSEVKILVNRFSLGAKPADDSARYATSNDPSGEAPASEARFVVVENDGDLPL